MATFRAVHRSCTMHYQWRLHPPPHAPYPAPTNKPELNRSQNQKVSNAKFNFQLGDDVYLRPKSAKELGMSGRIVDIYDAVSASGVANKGAPSKPSKRRRLVEDVRVSIQPHCFGRAGEKNAPGTGNPCGTIKQNVRPSRLFPIYDIECGKKPRGPLIVITPDTTNYRQLATAHLRPADKVLEIGCSTGETTALLLRRLLLLHRQQDSDGEERMRGRVVAFDTGADMLETAKDRLRAELDRVVSTGGDEQTRESLHAQMVHYHKVNALADPRGARSRAGAPGMVLVDIGGNRETRGVAGMLHWVQSSFQKDPPRVIIVKSEALAKELTMSVELKGCEIESKRDPSIAVDGIYVSRTGLICNGQEWFSSLLPSPEKDSADDVLPKKSLPLYSHPTKAPLALSPTDNVTPICRFHNYHPDGCLRYLGDSHTCPYDHEHCHRCGKAGHVALQCDAQDL